MLKYVIRGLSGSKAGYVIRGSEAQDVEAIQAIFVEYDSCLNNVETIYNGMKLLPMMESVIWQNIPCAIPHTTQTYIQL